MSSVHILYDAANTLSTRAELGGPAQSRPPIYKTIGIVLAIASGCFIGVSFIFSKIGLLKANKKYDEIPGEGYGYLKNAWWWGGMSLMIVGEICNFVAYAFTDAILVASMGALSVVISTVLSAIFLKERLSAVGMVGCLLCILGSVVIALNIPASSSVTNIQEMQHFVVQPGILVYGGLVIVGCVFIGVWVAPRYGNKTVLVYLSICSLIGGLSVVATQGLGSAILAQIGGQKQFNQWFLYVLFAFVVVTLVTEIIYLNKALNIFNAALVTPTYYVYFTSATIVTSAILFKGFGGTPSQIITVIMGFLTICSGVALLQLSKSAKDVPDAAVFSGNLDQIRTIAEQEQPESEPKADAIRGTAAIIRRLSTARQNMELAEARRLHDDMQSDLQPVSENEQIEWDGLRRRRTTYGSAHRPFTPAYTASPHPPLGMSRFPTDEELAAEERPTTGSLTPSFLGTIRTRARSMVPGSIRHVDDGGAQSPMHPVALTSIAVPGYYDTTGLDEQKTAYDAHASGGSGGEPHIQFAEDPRGAGSHLAVERPPQSARRQFSFQNVFRKGNATPNIEDMSDREIRARERELASHRNRPGLGSRGTSHSVKKAGGGASEEERAGLVRPRGDSGSDVTRSFPEYEEEEGWEAGMAEAEKPPPVPKHGGGDGGYEAIRGGGRGGRGGAGGRGRRGTDGSESPPLPPLPPFEKGGGSGSFI
ncbi:hypothetical protein VF21_07736 [Pseudogymnoascus sp. 05NY08]|nr:hypothetical protein VF21_07736 [Pseudogymnoascus sp. 05NY08]